MTTYVAFLRGINVGGNALIKMAELRDQLDKAGLADVSTYIQSGNVLFKSDSTDKKQLASLITKVIANNFNLNVAVVVFTKKEWQQVIAAAPDWWGKDTEWRHNILIMIEPVDITETATAYGVLKPDIENMSAGNGILYQSMSRQFVGRTTGSKIVGNPIYKKMTIRNYNTANKLLGLLEQL